MAEKTNLRVVQMYTQKKGWVAHVYERQATKGKKSKKIADIYVGREVIFEENVDMETQVEVSFIANNLAFFDAGDMLERERMLISIPKKLHERVMAAAVKAKKMNVEFNPAKRMLIGLLMEVKDIEGGHAVKTRHLNERIIFDKLVEIKNYMTDFKQIAKTRYGKKLIKTNEGLIDLYKKGKSKPTLMEYAITLEVLKKHRIDVFDLGIPKEKILKLWFDGNKAESDGAQMAEEFNDVFEPDEPKEVAGLIKEWYAAYSKVRDSYRA